MRWTQVWQARPPNRGAKEGIAPLFALVQTVEGNLELQNNSNNVQEMRLDMLYSE